ncbi:MAG: hypothetical protein V2J07_11380 [Anaerolineae bacterium]|jgi:hypothetical protein|nr:hypothetical protein [Anaerolineae bacterium]
MLIGIIALAWLYLAGRSLVTLEALPFLLVYAVVLFVSSIFLAIAEWHRLQRK